MSVRTIDIIQDDGVLPSPAKKQKLLACRRCRHRKQKVSSNIEYRISNIRLKANSSQCDEVRPCENCTRSEEECVPTEPASAKSQYETGFIQVLEQRIAELESLNPRESLDHLPQPFPTEHASARESQGELHRLNNTRKRKRAYSKSINLNLHLPEISIDSSQTTFATHSTAQQAPSVSPNHENSSNSPRNFLGNHSASVVDSAAELASMNRRHWRNATIQTGFETSTVEGITVLASMDHGRNGEIGSSHSNSTSVNNIPQAIASADNSAPPINISPQMEDLFVKAYFERAYCRYPFLGPRTFYTWLNSWKSHSSQLNPSDENDLWKGFFVNMVYAVGLLLATQDATERKHSSQTIYNYAVSVYFPAVLAHHNRVLHAQAYLLMAMHALHSPSSEKIITLASCAMRSCTMGQLHISESVLGLSNKATFQELQTRRRVFWSAYALDRAVGTAFDLPFTISDDNISVEMFANVDDDERLLQATDSPRTRELQNSVSRTSISSALHIVHCRRIQSEILSTTLHHSFLKHPNSISDWRSRILAKLDHWKSQCKQFSDPDSKGYTSDGWLGMIYHYSLVMLYRPTKASVSGPAGDWSVQASSKACLIFRGFQKERTIAQHWLGLLTQFQIGVTLLYCFWATPPRFRTDSYYSPDVPDALRACSNVLAILAERWKEADCLRDVFELLARNIPLVDRPLHPRRGHPDYEKGTYSSPQRVSSEVENKIRSRWAMLESLVVHRAILRMIDEMISEDFPRPEDDAAEEVIEQGSRLQLIRPRWSYIDQQQFTGDNDNGLALQSSFLDNSFSFLTTNSWPLGEMGQNFDQISSIQIT
ncbi:MAG: hypothetical protein M1834_006899 [Cirrosporium novae-zelandiae]|nr:MAG: hypothetical protein M1834_006899 [Cirrosporium novae-zelandiae]